MEPEQLSSITSVVYSGAIGIFILSIAMKVIWGKLFPVQPTVKSDSGALHEEVKIIREEVRGLFSITRDIEKSVAVLIDRSNTTKTEREDGHKIYALGKNNA